LVQPRLTHAPGVWGRASSSDLIRPKLTEKVHRDNRLGAQAPIQRSPRNFENEPRNLENLMVVLLSLHIGESIFSRGGK